MRHMMRHAGGVLFFALIAYLLVILPGNFLLGRLDVLTGEPVPGAGRAAVFVLWGAAVFLLLQLLIRLRIRLNLRKHGSERPRNMFDDVMEAMDRISSGDYNVYVEQESRYHYSELAEKVNRLASDLSSMEQMRQEFISNVSHEIQSPLTSIRGFAVLLKKEDLPREKRLHYLEVIETESERLSRLSDNLLRLSVLDGDNLTEATRLRLDKQLEETLLLLEPQWAGKRIKVEADLEKLEIYGDADLLSQVWINLLHNAVKFTPEEGRISITLQRREDRAVCTVSDTGAGISPETLPRIFERFYKADKARDRSLGGNGLGLSIVKQIVDRHRGTITAASTEGEGSVFTVTLPLERE